MDINGKAAYSYSCLTKVPQPGFIGLAYETVLPGSLIKPSASANNIVFTLVPQNFTGFFSNPLPPAGDAMTCAARRDPAAREV